MRSYVASDRLDQLFAPFLSNLAYPAGLIVSPIAAKR